MCEALSSNSSNAKKKKSIFDLCERTVLEEIPRDISPTNKMLIWHI
jgi:hypothetical protein